MSRMSPAGSDVALSPRFTMDALEPRLFLNGELPDGVYTMRVEHGATGRIVTVTGPSGELQGLALESFLSATTFDDPSRPDLPSPQDPGIPPSTPQPEAPPEGPVESSDRSEQPPPRPSDAHLPKPPATQNLLAHSAHPVSQTPRALTSASNAAIASTLAATLTRAVRLAFAYPFSSMPLAAPQPAAPAARFADTVLPDIELPRTVHDVLSTYTRTFHIAQMGSPFTLLADSLAAFADECASIPRTASAQARSTSAWPVTATVVAADLLLAAWAYHRAWQRRQPQAVRIRHTFTTHEI